jgi:glycosyltransferase involved in cell wall biosynthesis
MHADPAMAPGYGEWGGTHTYMKELMDRFETRKIRCLVVTRKSMPLPDVEQYNNYCTVYRLHNGDVGYMDKTLLQNYHQENLCKIQEIIDRHGKPVVIHSVYWNSGRLAMELSQKNGTHFVHSVISNSRGRVSRGAAEPVHARAGYEQQIYNEACWILCVSDDEKDDIVNLYAINPDKVCVVGQYIHEAFLLPAHDDNGFPRLNSKIEYSLQEQIASIYNNAYDIKDSDFYWVQKAFTYMGRMCFYKGVDHIMNAWYCLYQKYGEHCPALWMIGGSLEEISELRKKMKQQIAELDDLERKGRIIWWGYLDAVGLSTILLKSHLLLAHSRYEPGGRVVVEAMSEGIPVIATPNGFAKDYIKNWRNGFLVVYGDVKNLFLRLEHFVRHPFLSNSLGQNARKDARSIIRQWNFLDNHLMAYGIETEEIVAGKEDVSHDYFKMRNIHLFPYYNIPLSEEYIKNTFEEITGQSVVDIQTGVNSEYTSHIFKVWSSSGCFVFKQSYTRLAITPFFNPFGKGKYVRQAERHFELELTIYKRTESNVLVGYEPTHQLLILRNLTPGNYSDLEFLLECIRYIIIKKDIATPVELDLFHEIMQSDMDTYEEIRQVYERLEKELPAFYFEVSGLFYGKLGWAESLILLSYNSDYIETSLLQELQEIASFFIRTSSACNRKGLRYINTDTELKHFMYDGEHIEMIDFERCALGYRENEIASLLYDYIFNYSSDKAVEEILDLIPTDLNRKIVMADMAYRVFYDIILQSVMGDSSLNKLTELLKFLYDKTRKNK